jgi:hypothetical protein
MLSTKPKPLVLSTLPDEDAPPKLRYSPLPGLAVADYMEDYVQHLGQTGVFDYLSTMGQGVDVDDVKRLDFAALGVLGNAATRMLSTDGGAPKKRLTEMIMDHCRRFHVQAWDAAAEDWVDLDKPDSVNAWLSIGHHAELIKTLGGEALRPLWSRLSSRGEERPSESPKPSPEPSMES